MNNQKVPKIRFKGFSGDWEQRKVGELTNVLSASRVHKEEWAEDGVPFFRSSDVVSAFKGTDNEKAFISFDLYEQLAKSSGKLEQNDILITGGGSIGIPYIVPDNKPLYSKDADLIWIKHSDKFDSRYLYTYFTSEGFRRYLSSISHTGTIAHYTIEQVKDTPVELSSIDEQKTLGEFFDNLNSLITLHQSKLDKLKTIKKSMLENCFPKNGEKVPKIRFSGFTDDWEQRKFSDIYEKNNERNNGQFGWNRTISTSTMTFNEIGNGAADSSIDNYKILRVGDIAFEGHTNKEFRYGRFVLNDIGDGIMSPRFATLRPIIKQDLSFWKPYIHDERVMRKKLVRSTKAGTMMNELVIDDLMEQLILVPSLQEQKKIGAFFEGLDNLITLHQSKLDKLKVIKKTLLESMFV